MSEPVSISLGDLKKRNQAATGIMSAGLAVGALSTSHVRSRNALAAGALIGLIAYGIETANDAEVLAVSQHTVELKDGHIVEVLQIDAAPILEGSPVLVRSYHSGKLKMVFDRTQGRTYERTNKTQYTNKTEEQLEQERQTATRTEQAAFRESHARRRIEAETKMTETISDKTGETVDSINNTRNKQTIRIETIDESNKN